MESKKYFIFNKGEKFKLSDNFSSHELECKCSRADCIEQKISVNLIEKLQKIREKLGKSLKITSGYRCEAHNKAIGGAAKSQHILGNAADLKTEDMDSLEALVEVEFDAVGNAKPSFLHVDVRDTKNKLRWTY